MGRIPIHTNWKELDSDTPEPLKAAATQVAGHPEPNFLTALNIQKCDLGSGPYASSL